MRKTALIINVLWWIIIAIFQTSVAVNWRIAGAVPNLLIIAIVITVMLQQQKVNWISLLCAGIIVDAANNMKIGISVLILIALTAILSLIKDRYIRDSSILAMFFAVILMTTLYNLFAIIVLQQWHFSLISLSVSAIYSSVLSVVFVAIMLLVKDWIQHRRYKARIN